MICRRVQRKIQTQTVADLDDVELTPPKSIMFVDFKIWVTSLLQAVGVAKMLINIAKLTIISIRCFIFPTLITYIRPSLVLEPYSAIFEEFVKQYALGLG